MYIDKSWTEFSIEKQKADYSRMNVSFNEKTLYGYDY